MHKKSLEEIKKLKMETNDTPSNKRGGRKVDVKILEEALAAKDRELEEKKEELEPIQREVEKMHEELAKMEREVQRKDAELQTKDRLIEVRSAHPPFGSASSQTCSYIRLFRECFKEEAGIGLQVVGNPSL